MLYAKLRTYTSGGSGKGLLGAFPKEPSKEDQSPGDSSASKLMSKPPKPSARPLGSQKTSVKESGGQSSSQSTKSNNDAKNNEPSCVKNPDRGAYLLERAEKLCRELREKRELAKRDSENEVCLRGFVPDLSNVMSNIQYLKLNCVTKLFDYLATLIYLT